MSGAEAPSSWLTTDGLSELLGSIPTATIRGWRHVGTGPPFVKFGGSVRYSRAAVERWIAAGGDRKGAAPETTARPAPGHSR